MKQAVKRDGQQAIIAILHHPTFAQAAKGFCETACLFPGTPTDRARYLGLIGWRFSDQTDFPRIADQKAATNDSLKVKAFFTFTDAIVTIEMNRRDARRKEAEARAKEKDIVMLGLSSSPATKRKANVSSANKLNVISWHLDTLMLMLVFPHTNPDSKPKPKKVKVTPSVAGYKMGSELALLLLGQVNATFESVSLTDGNETTPRDELQKHREAVELAAQQHLHFLDTSLQTYKLIVACLSCLDKALSSSDVDHTGSLLDTLNVLFESTHEDSNAEFVDPPEDASDSTMPEVHAAMEV
ncbi:hypothetical protein C0992_005215 [Termitomyces sp. T32_za158]|nr:hypothetical protein C0992_005215 [Termitomyces sp. T32_za158]